MSAASAKRDSDSVMSAQEVEAMLRQRPNVPLKVAAWVLDRHPNSLYRDIKNGLVPTAGLGRLVKIPSAFVLERAGFDTAPQPKEPAAEAP